MWNPEVWYAIPSANTARAVACLAVWRSRGYRTAVFLDEGAPSVGADLEVRGAYPGYFAAVNRLVTHIGPTADVVVTGGDDMYPDPDHAPSDIARQFYTRFPDGAGVMQPVGDTLTGTDQICGSPWFGRGWLLRAYEGQGPFHPGYTAFFGDEELLHVARQQGRLWQRPDLVQRHDHYTRPGGPPIEPYQERNQRYWAMDQQLFHERRDAGWPQAGLRDVARLSLLICTTEARWSWLERLGNNLRPQVLSVLPEVEVIVETDRGERSVGIKRQALLEQASGRYVAFIDDDDLVASDYVSRILAALDLGPDCVGFRGVITTNGENPEVFEHALRHEEWCTREGVHLRCPNHLNPVRRDLALRVGFPAIHYGEDRDYSVRLRPLLQTEVFLEGEPMYHYEYRTRK